VMKLFAHFDIDAFYAQVEQLKNPQLRGKPLIVGGNSLRRSVVASASYEARVYGVKSGMPLFQALRLCPRCIVVPPDFPLYERSSRKFYQLLYSISPDLEILSQDEGVVDLSRCNLLYGDPIGTLRRKRRAMVKELGITVSLGMASSRLTAKLAASRAKPNGFLYIPRDKELEFLKTFSLEDIPGIGKKTLALLKNLGVNSVSDLLSFSKDKMKETLGKKGENLLLQLHGLDFSPGIAYERPKSVSRGYTLEKDIHTPEEARPHLLYLSDSVAMRLREEGARSERVCLRIRRADFSESQKCLPLSPPGNDTLRIYQRALSMARSLMTGQPVRLLAVEASSIIYADQKLLFTPPEERIMEAVERIRKKFGFSSIRFLGEKREGPQGVHVFRNARKLF